MNEVAEIRNSRSCITPNLTGQLTPLVGLNMKPFLLFLAITCSNLSAAEPPIVLSKNRDGLAIEISKMPVAGSGKLGDVTREDEGVVQLRLLTSDRSPHSKPQVIPMRFAPVSEVGDVPCVWNKNGGTAAFILPCYEAQGDDQIRLFLADVKAGQIELLALPDVVTHIASQRKDLIRLEIEWSDHCFGWIDDNLLVVHFHGGCELASDAGSSEGREIGGYVVFYVTQDRKVTVREILSLRIQG